MLPAALLVAVESRVADVQAHDSREGRPVLVGVGHGERHPAAVGAGIHRPAHRIARIEAGDRLEEAILAHRQIGLHVQALRVHVPAQQRGIDDLALAGLVAMVERDEGAEREHHRRLHLSDAGVDRRLTRLDQRRHHAGASRRELVVGGKVAIGPLGPEARAAGVDDVRPELAEAPVVPALLLQLPEREVGQEDVRAPHQLPQDLATRRIAEIHRQALLVAMGQLVERVPALGRVHPVAIVIDLAGVGEIHHPDHRRPEVAEQRAGQRAKELAGEIQDHDAFERPAHGLCMPPGRGRVAIWTPPGPCRLKSPARCWHHAAWPLP